MSPESDRLQALIQKRTPYQHPDVPFIVLWSQKSGCTSILKWFLWHAGLLEEARQYRVHEEGLSIHNYELEVFKMWPGYDEELLARIESGAPLVNFIRCPYSRAFSSYMHLHNRFYIRFERDGLPHDGLSLRYEILESIYGYRPPVEYPLSFLDYLQWLAAHSINEVEPHHAQQYTPLYDLENVTHYRLEELETVIPRLERDYRLADSGQARTEFTSPHHLEKTAVDRAAAIKLLERGVPLSKSPQYLLPEVNRELLAGTACGELIEQIFKDDIAVYDSIL